MSSRRVRRRRSRLLDRIADRSWARVASWCPPDCDPVLHRRRVTNAVLDALGDVPVRLVVTVESGPAALRVVDALNAAAPSPDVFDRLRDRLLCDGGSVIVAMARP